MKGIQSKLDDMLFCRERRLQIQEKFIKKYHCPIISFCMNIPGPVKINLEIRNAFEKGKHEIMCFLHENHIPVADSVEIHEKTGDEMILAVNYPATELKQEAFLIEESHTYGRLFDIDIIDSNGVKLSRSSPRKCILCGRIAQECARARIHSVEEMQNKIEEMLALQL